MLGIEAVHCQSVSVRSIAPVRPPRGRSLVERRVLDRGEPAEVAGTFGVAGRHFDRCERLAERLPQRLLPAQIEILRRLRRARTSRRRCAPRSRSRRRRPRTVRPGRRSRVGGPASPHRVGEGEHAGRRALRRLRRRQRQVAEQESRQALERKRAERDGADLGGALVAADHVLMEVDQHRAVAVDVERPQPLVEERMGGADLIPRRIVRAGAAGGTDRGPRRWSAAPASVVDCRARRRARSTACWSPNARSRPAATWSRSLAQPTAASTQRNAKSARVTIGAARYEPVSSRASLRRRPSTLSSSMARARR